MVSKLGFLCPFLDTKTDFRRIKGKKFDIDVVKRIYSILIHLLIYVMPYLILIN
jgi:hypothetical protein